MPTQPNRDRHLRVDRIGGVALALLVLVAGGFSWRVLTTSPKSLEPSARESAVAAAPDADRLVGTRRCVDCHATQGAAHARSGHNRTFARSKDSEIALSLCGQSMPASDGYDRLDYQCDDEGLLVGDAARFANRLFPLDFAFGSGDHAVTFLTLTHALDAEDGLIGIEHRYSWYADTRALAVTPGQQHHLPEREIEYFGRSFQGAVLRRCIDCHTTAFDLVGDKLENVVAGVQCEECHGSGARHVAAIATASETPRDLSIVRPSSAIEEISLCGRCHRLPDDIDADRLERYPPSVTRFQPVGLLRSRCYLESEGRLKCTTCHDAHAPLSSRTHADQVAACRRCHQPNHDALCSAGEVSNCIECHMQARELIQGFVFHDHWIRRLPSGDESSSIEGVPPVSGDCPLP